MSGGELSNFPWHRYKDTVLVTIPDHMACFYWEAISKEFNLPRDISYLIRRYLTRKAIVCRYSGRETCGIMCLAFDAVKLAEQQLNTLCLEMQHMRLLVKHNTILAPTICKTCKRTYCAVTQVKCFPQNQMYCSKKCKKKDYK